MKKDLVNIEGTVAYVMEKNIEQVNFYGTLDDAKRTVISILSSDEIKQKDLARKYIVEINRMQNMRHLMSTITTYLTGTKVYSTKRRIKV